MSEASRHEAESIRTGMMVEVLTQENTLIFLGRIEDLDDTTVQVKEVSGKRLPSIIFNTIVKLRSISTTGKVSLLTGKVTGNGEFQWRLDRLTEKHIQDSRASYRQRVNVEAKVHRVSNVENTEEREGCLLNISMGGVLLRCGGEYRMGEYLQLEDARIIPEEEPFRFTCFVRRVERNKRDYLYGCEFGELSNQEQERLFRAIFMAQQKELRQKRSRY